MEWLSASIPPGHLIFVGVVLAGTRLICLGSRAILAWVEGRARVAEIEATSRAELIKVHEVGKVLVALAELGARHADDFRPRDSTRPGNTEDPVKPWRGQSP